MNKFEVKRKTKQKQIWMYIGVALNLKPVRQVNAWAKGQELRQNAR